MVEDRNADARLRDGRIADARLAGARVAAVRLAAARLRDNWLADARLRDGRTAADDDARVPGFIPVVGRMEAVRVTGLIEGRMDTDARDKEGTKVLERRMPELMAGLREIEDARLTPAGLE